jgi:fimbrial isopeptide formation D2 family protein
LPAGGSITVTYSATLGASLTPNQTLSNAATVTYTSLPGANGTNPNPTGSMTPGTPGSSTGERAGSGTAPNDLTASRAATVTVLTLSPTKSVVGTSEAATSGTNATIGEIVRYRLRVRLAESNALTAFQIQDALPIGMTFLSDGTARVALVSNGPGITSSTLSGAGLAVSGNQTNVGSITPTFVLPPTAILGAPFVTGTDPIFSLGNLNNQDRDSDEEFIVLDFNADRQRQQGGEYFQRRRGRHRDLHRCLFQHRHIPRVQRSRDRFAAGCGHLERRKH